MDFWHAVFGSICGASCTIIVCALALLTVPDASDPNFYDHVTLHGRIWKTSAVIAFIGGFFASIMYVR